MLAQLNSTARGLILWPGLLPLGLWLGLQSEGFYRIGDPGVYPLLQALRGAAPFLAAIVAVGLILFRARSQSGSVRMLASPLGLTVVYGLVGMVSAFASPRGEVAAYWAGIYLTVPVVLWAAVFGRDSLDRVRRLMNFIWMGLFLAVTGLFAMGLLFVDLGGFITTPSTWLNCNLSEPWLAHTSGNITPNGVGRYAALGALIALSRLWQRNQPILWVVFLTGALLLLYTSGSRSALGGFTAAAFIMLVLYGGRKAALAGAGVAVLVLPLLWFTGPGNVLLSNCVFQKWQDNSRPTLSLTPSPDIQPLIQIDATGQSAEITTPEQTATTEATSRQGVDSEPAELTAPRDSVQTDPTATTSEVDAGSPPVPVPADTDQVSEGQKDAEKLQQLVDDTPPYVEPSLLGRIPISFFKLTGRTAVWGEALELVSSSPLLGRGFHADRLILKTHIHNTYIHALLQTGILGAPFLYGALAWAWLILAGTVRRLTILETRHKHLTIQAAGVLAFLSMRSFIESTGAFFGVDWLLLGLVFVYLQTIRQSPTYTGGAVPPASAPTSQIR